MQCIPCRSELTLYFVSILFSFSLFVSVFFFFFFCFCSCFVYWLINTGKELSQRFFKGMIQTFQLFRNVSSINVSLFIDCLFFADGSNVQQRTVGKRKALVQLTNSPERKRTKIFHHEGILYLQIWFLLRAKLEIDL